MSNDGAWLLKAIQRRLDSGERRAASAVPMSAVDVVAKMLEQNNRCYYCGEPIGKDFHLDHYLPIAQGGQHSIDNLVVTCPKCNLSKGARTGGVHQVKHGGRQMSHSKIEKLSMERRYTQGAIETRDVDGATGLSLRGYAAMFGSLSADLGGFYERISPKAFNRTIQTADVRALFNHNPDVVLGRTKSGTLRLDKDERGLIYEIDLPDTVQARDLHILVGRGDISQSSFAFRTIKDEWEIDDQERLIRTLHEVQLYDVSPVTYPAYTSTDVQTNSVALRSLAHALDASVDDVVAAYDAGELRSLFAPTRAAAPVADPVATPLDNPETVVRDDGVYTVVTIPTGKRKWKPQPRHVLEFYDLETKNKARSQGRESGLFNGQNRSIT